MPRPDIIDQHVYLAEPLERLRDYLLARVCIGDIGQLPQQLAGILPVENQSSSACSRAAVTTTDAPSCR